jgi:O-antigen biosynthesis protein
MPGRIRTPVGLFLYRVWYWGFHPRMWKHGLRKALRAVIPPPIRAWLRRTATGLREGLRRRPPSAAPAEPAPEKDPSEPLRFPESEQPLVSIVVPARNHWPHTYRCLHAVLENTEGVEYEVILADDASDDDTTGAAELLEGVTVLSDGVHRGYLENCNAAAEHARGELIVFLNNDTIVQPGWLEALVELTKDDTVGIVGAKLVGEDGLIQEAGSIVWRDCSAANYGRGLEQDAPEVSYVKEVDYVSGACLLVRASLWRDIGGFDPRFAPGYWEDPDLAFEARKRGYRVVYQPLAVVVHSWGVSHGRDTSAGVKRYQVTNQQVFFEKWRDELERNHVDPADEFVARDRSQGRSVVLVADHEVPQMDRDAGSRFIDSYARLLVDMGFSVKFVGGSFGRTEPYTTSLQQHGIEVIYGRRHAETMGEWLEQNGPYLDAAYLHKWFVAVDYVEMLRKHSSARIVYCPCDLHYVREQRRFAVTRDAEIFERAKTTQEAELDLLAKADAVHVVSVYEEELVRAVMPGTTVRTVPVFLYDEPPPGDRLPFEERRNVMLVAGYAHEPNSDAAVWFANEVWPLVREQLPDVLFFVVGSNPTPEVLALAGNGIVVTGRVSERALVELYCRMRVVVCPLRFGAGVKGKLVEALYHQVPAVVTPIAAEGLPGIEKHVAIADGAEEYARGVVELYTDSERWTALASGLAGYVAPRFTRAAAVEAILSDLPSPDRTGDGAPNTRRVASR